MLTHEARWNTEAEFFDEQARAAAAKLAPFDARTRKRYQTPRSAFAPEFRFRVLGDLRDRRVVDVGCGEGPNSALLALLGAKVTGIDLSAGALDVARARATLEGVAKQCKFVCSPMETAPIADRTCDVVFCDAILHHLLDDLDGAMRRLMRFLRPGGVFLCVEPVSLSPILRRLRPLVPVRTAHTPDERPLDANDCAIIKRHVPDLKMKYFRFLGRLERLVLPGQNYECAPLGQRIATWTLAHIDELLLSLPPLRNLGSVAVMWGSAP
jgi:SAM-dependent methyltransferase